MPGAHGESAPVRVMQLAQSAACEHVMARTQQLVSTQDAQLVVAKVNPHAEAPPLVPPVPVAWLPVPPEPVRFGTGEFWSQRY